MASVCPIHFWRNNKRTVLALSAVSGLAVLWSSAVWRNVFVRSNEALPTFANPDWMTTRDTCQSTLMQPFRAGCPASCKRAAVNETMYRMSAEWAFAQAILFDESQLPVAFDKGVNYRCPRQFVENYISAGTRLRDESTIASIRPNLTFKHQPRIHMSLAYLCCLRRNETDRVREIVHEWILQNRPFDFTVKFNKLECWQERYNSITNIIVGDDETQRTVMRLVHDLYQYLERRGIPMEIPREQQMPIHVTLAGLYHGTGEGQVPLDNIEPSIPAVHSIVSRISQDYGDAWAGKDRMRVAFDPYFDHEGVWHAGPKPDAAPNV